MIRPVVVTLLLMAGMGFLASQSSDFLVAQESKSEKKAPGSVDTDKESPKSALAETKPPKQMDAKVIAKLIDDDINAQLGQAKLTASPRSSDAEFMRRVSLDITGVIPTAERVVAFLSDSDPNKRSKLIDELLASSKYGHHLADIWGNLMYHVDSDNRFVTKEPLIKYLADSFNANKPWDRMVREILTADGEQEKKGEVTYFLANRGVDKITDSVGKLFLGVQIQCAQCHNHPFTHWKQTEYWGMAQFFYKVNAQVQRNAKTEVKPVVEEISRPQRKINPLPDSAKNVSPKFLGGGSPRLSSTKPYRPVLADWVCTPENPFFGKAIVNRVWAQYFGRGLVNPIDDLADENEPTHPALLKGLAKEFTSGGFDLKQLVRAITLSEAYQRTSIPTPENKSDNVLYSHAAIRVMTPEQLFDSLTSVIGTLGESGKLTGKMMGPARTPPNARDRFVAFFAGSEDPKATDYEAGIPQALRLMNNPRLSGSQNLLNSLARSAGEPRKVFEKLYLMTVSRKPNDGEITKLTEYMARAGDAKTAYGDILWVLLNSSEFVLNH